MLAPGPLDTVRSVDAFREQEEQERSRLRTAADESANDLRRAGLIANASVVDGDPRKELLRASEQWNAAAIFVGARGLGRFERLLLGSVSTAVVTHARCTVEIVREAS
jgi:nucleotide-binding universal stress UspA family protein